MREGQVLAGRPSRPCYFLAGPACNARRASMRCESCSCQQIVIGMNNFWTNSLTVAVCCFVNSLATTEPVLAVSPLDSGVTRSDVENRTYLSYVTESLDNLLLHGTDRYGAVQSGLLVSNLDVTTKDNPIAADLGAADEAWRVERRQRRAPGGSNFLHNQSVYRAMLRASQVTGNNDYSNFVDSNFDFALSNLIDGNGMFWWGYHRHYDVHTDTLEAQEGSPFHEMHYVDVPLWEEMWNRNPSAVQNEIEAIWDRHVVDKATGQINRHDDPGGLSFITSSASFIEAFAFLSSKLSGNDRVLWRGRALLLANYNWNERDPTTNLLAHTPNETSRWDGVRSATTTPGVFVPALMRAFEACPRPLKSFSPASRPYRIARDIRWRPGSPPCLHGSRCLFQICGAGHRRQAAPCS